MTSINNDSTIKSQTSTATQAAANQNIRAGGEEVVDGAQKVAKGLGAKAKDLFVGTGRNISWAAKDAKYSPVQVAKAVPGRAKVEFNNITTPRNLATHRGMIGSLVGAGVCTASAMGMVFFDKTLELFAGLLLHDLLIYAAVASSLWFVAQALIRLFRVTDVASSTTSVTEGVAESAEQLAGAARLDTQAETNATPAKEPSKSEVEARAEKAKAAYEAAVAKKAALEQKKADVKDIDEELSAADKEVETEAAEYGYHAKFVKEFGTVVGSVDAQARIAELEAALAKVGKKTEEAAKLEADAQATVDGALSGSNASTAGVEVKEKTTTETTKTVTPVVVEDEKADKAA